MDRIEFSADFRLRIDHSFQDELKRNHKVEFYRRKQQLVEEGLWLGEDS